MAPTVVVLGGGYAGIFTAHKLLKHTTPKVKGLKVIMVTPSTHFYPNPAAVRGIIPGEIPDDTLFIPIEPGFARYGKDKFEFVVGTAKTLEPETNTIRVETASDVSREIKYDHVVIATGSSTSSGLPLKTLDSHQNTLNALHELQDRIAAKATKSIVVAGAGPTGVEIAGELGHRYGADKDKTITLVADGDRVLPNNLESLAKVAEAQLAKLGVRIVHNARVTESRDGHAYLSTEKVIPADVYIPVFGVTPNTSFVPGKYLDSTKSLKLDLTFRVESLKNVWGLGDAGNLQTKQLSTMDAQVTHLTHNLDAALAGKEGTMKTYTPSTKPMIFVTLGKAAGTGQFANWKVPGFMVTMMKSKTMMLDKPPGQVNGKSMVMGSI